jgi:amino acid adenylation domain-containing protein
LKLETLHSTSLKEDTIAQRQAYWKRTLLDFPAQQLPADHPRPLISTYFKATQPLELPPHLRGALKTLSDCEGSNLFITLLTAFKVLLARYTWQEDSVVGSPVANCRRTETGQPAETLRQTLALRARLDGNPTFREAMQGVRAAFGASENQEVSFKALVDGAALQHNSDQCSIFPVISVRLDNCFEMSGTQDLTAVLLEAEHDLAKVDVQLSFFNSIDDLRGFLSYNVDLFDAATMRRVAGHFRTLLVGIVADPGAHISELPMLTAGELQQITIEWNRSETEFPRNASIDELFENRAGQRPESIAVEDQVTRWTYRELNKRSNQIAHFLREAGATAESLVAICMERSVQMIAGMLAILKAGSAYVPIDPAYPAERRSLMLEGVPLLLTTKKLAGKFVHCAVRVICVDDERVLQASAENLPRLSIGESLAYVIYTSGSTGQPKGVAVMHRGVIRLFCNSNFLAIEESDVVAQTLNVCFDAAMQEIWGALLNGARLVILDKESMLSPSRFQQELERRGITVLTLIRALFNLLAREAPGAFAKLNYVVLGGEPADPRSVAAVLKYGPPKHLLNAYGPTEASVAATCMEVRAVFEGAISIPIGRPISNTTIYLLDGHQIPVPIGVAGEIYIGGPGVARGYVGAPQLTAERFIDDPFSNELGARLYKTGDLARWLSDGTIDLIGRADAQVKIRGFRIEPSEIEAVLKQHPGVRDAVVLLQGDAPGEKRLVAYVADERLRLNATELRDFLKSKLPDYMLPAKIVVLEKFPLNSNGKIDRHALPKPGATRCEKVFVGARDSVEAQLVAVWESALGIQPIGVTDDFFQIGGHSLMAAHIFTEIESTLGKNLPLATLFQTPTIEKLAAALRQKGWKPTWKPIVAIQSNGSRPPFFGVHGGFGAVLFYSDLARCLGAEQPLYGIQAQGLDGGPIEHTSVEAMATYYIEEMRSVQPNGPYFFGGYSFGGFVAFEMAQQLRAAGEQVALVVLFDTYNRWRRCSLAERIRFRLRARELSSPGKKLQYLMQRTWGKLGAILVKSHEDAQKLLHKLKKLNLGRVSTEPRGLHVVHRAHMSALAAYKLHAYSGRITVFRAEKPYNGYEYVDDHGWTRFAKGGIEIHEVPGEHDTIFAPPNVRALAEKLDACIRPALAENTRG